MTATSAQRSSVGTPGLQSGTTRSGRTNDNRRKLTHDQSFIPIRGERRSVNNRVITAELTPARFGRALMRLLHYICLLRRRFPGERLLLTKVDCKFGDECPVHLAILARSMAGYLNDHGVAHYSQLFPGKENSVADSLSRDFHLGDVSHLRSNFANHLPQTFRFVHLTTTMISSVGKLLRLLPKTQQLPQEPVPSAAATGSVTQGSSTQSATSETRSSGDSGSWKRSKSWPASPPPCAKGGHATPEEIRQLALDDRRAQFVPPSTAWHRPFGLTNLAARSTTLEADSTPFWPHS